MVSYSVIPDARATVCFHVSHEHRRFIGILEIRGALFLPYQPADCLDRRFRAPLLRTGAFRAAE
jgi:hypothetical protein